MNAFKFPCGTVLNLQQIGIIHPIKGSGERFSFIVDTLFGKIEFVYNSKERTDFIRNQLVDSFTVTSCIDTKDEIFVDFISKANITQTTKRKVFQNRKQILDLFQYDIDLHSVSQIKFCVDDLSMIRRFGKKAIFEVKYALEKSHPYLFEKIEK